jgi:WD40 repeat protein
MEKGNEASASFLPGGRQVLLSLAGGAIEARDRGAIEVLNLETGQSRRLVWPSYCKISFGDQVALSRDGRTVFAFGTDHIIRQFDAATGKELVRSGSMQALARSTGFSPRAASPSADGRRVLMATIGRETYVWDVARNTKPRPLSVPTDGGLQHLALSPDGRRAIVAKRNIVYVWDVDADREIRQIELPHTLSYLAFAPDGKTALAASSGYLPKSTASVPGSSSLWLLDHETGKTLHQFDGHSNQGIIYVGVAGDGRRAITVGGDKTMRVWQLPVRK